MPELIEAINEKRLIEAFVAGTAVIVNPIRAINYEGKEYDIPIINSKSSGEITYRILKSI